ncbi:shikimate dehydrogenase [Loktanella sp. SALINAS62]|uniref:shikimate dehydrogenase n=1 Tax=Loktanella sp. SALINAS62 TaxID=2706124 RepID=UPI001B8BB033|nr:shikimate dehydrogenase [Loktanella sp. SALINAS62]MBS1303678.1 shikimate dehydrogenase [Loktanella sp. SALINAS62]
MGNETKVQSGRTGATQRAVRVGLIGRGIQQSRTPAMHTAEGRAHGLDYRYDLIDPDQPGVESDPAKIIAKAEADGFAGLNVTYPFKQAVFDLTDDLSDAARKVGAVNTLVFRDGKRFGHNTDFWGFAESMRRGLPNVTLSRVLLIGAGGAGAAVAFALQDLGVTDLMIADNRPDAAQALVDRVNRASGATIARAADDIAACASRAGGIVNATPMGMAKLPGVPLDPAYLTSSQWVAEIVYFPLETEFLRIARAKGCRTLDGSGMAVFQAVRAFHLFTGLNADADRLKATFGTFEAR